MKPSWPEPHPKKSLNWALKYTSKIQALGRLRQENYMFQASLRYKAINTLLRKGVELSEVRGGTIRGEGWDHKR